MKKVGVAILGLGTVGGGTYRILTEHREFYRRTQDLDLSVECVLELNRERIEALQIPEEKVASGIAEVVSDPAVDIVIEVIGGVGVAKDFVVAALSAGKSVVTSNKELIAKYSYELEKIARHKNCGLYYEASCVGGVPIVRALLDGLQANRICSMMGIVNGTTNYILDKMSNEGVSYEAALQKAQELGYAELDPVSDVEGFDSTYKLAILASMAFHTKIPYTKIYREGITGISVEDIVYGKELGYVVKLLAIGKVRPEGAEMRVHPTFIKTHHPLASVNDSFNAVYIKGDVVDDIMLYGRGAGAFPTGSAVVSDVIYAATHSDIRYTSIRNAEIGDKNGKISTDFSSAYYLRLTVTDKVGVLSKIARIFAHNGISIGEMIQKDDVDRDGNTTLLFITHETKEKAMRAAVAKISAVEEVIAVGSLIRVAG